jgi:cell division control protein 6
MSVFSELSESKIFKDEQVLFSEYLPEMLPHRDQQIKQLANNLLPASKGRKPQNTFLSGPPGIGKTVATKFVFREFEEYSDRVKTIYINCWDYRSAHAVLSKVAIDMGGFVQRRGMSKDEILERLVEVCKKKNKSIVVCLDEVDQLVFKESETLYDLLRINQYITNPVGLVFISNSPDVFLNVEPRIKSSLTVDSLEFKSYSLAEMKDILQERIELGYRDVPEQGVLLLSANHAVNNGGDVRIGLECLLKAGRLAEQEGSDRVCVSHVKRILPGVQPVKPKILEERISETEKAILDIVKEKNSWTSGELYEYYCKKTENPVTERAFRDFVNHLAEIKLINVRERKRGLKGKTRVIEKS